MPGPRVAWLSIPTSGRIYDNHLPEPGYASRSDRSTRSGPVRQDMVLKRFLVDHQCRAGNDDAGDAQGETEKKIGAFAGEERDGAEDDGDLQEGFA